MPIAASIVLFAFLNSGPAVVAQADVTVTISPSSVPEGGGSVTVTFSQNMPPVTSVTANGESVNFTQKAANSVVIHVPKRSQLNVDVGAAVPITILTGTDASGSVSALSTSFTYTAGAPS